MDSVPEVITYGVLGGYALALLLSILGMLPNVSRAFPSLAPPPTVVKVIDGDTISLGREKVRLWGVDTPETVHPKKGKEPFGPEAKKLTASLVHAKPVRLVRSEKKDKYGRTLAYVYLPDGRSVNEELLRKGLARHTPQYSHPLKKQYAVIESMARKKRLGIWKGAKWAQ